MDSQIESQQRQLELRLKSLLIKLQIDFNQFRKNFETNLEKYGSFDKLKCLEEFCRQKLVENQIGENKINEIIIIIFKKHQNNEKGDLLSNEAKSTFRKELQDNLSEDVWSSIRLIITVVAAGYIGHLVRMESTQENLEYLKDYLYLIPTFIFMNKQIEKRVEFFLDARKQIR